MCRHISVGSKARVLAIVSEATGPKRKNVLAGQTEALPLTARDIEQSSVCYASNNGVSLNDVLLIGIAQRVLTDRWRIRMSATASVGER